MITPCCYVSTALGWASGMRDTHPIDGYITDSGNHGDDINPLMKEFVDSYSIPNKIPQTHHHFTPKMFPK
jgi:hypothetical protein